MIKRGEIYYVDWSPGRGSERAGTRPALIIQDDIGNQFSSTTIVTAISTRQARAYPFQVAVTAEESGLPRDSIVRCAHIQAIDQTRLGQLVGALEAEKVSEVDFALQQSLGLET